MDPPTSMENWLFLIGEELFLLALDIQSITPMMSLVKKVVWSSTWSSNTNEKLER